MCPPDRPQAPGVGHIHGKGRLHGRTGAIAALFFHEIWRGIAQGLRPAKSLLHPQITLKPLQESAAWWRIKGLANHG